MATFLVTGTAGFIGYHVAERLLARGDTVVGIDVVNDYYDVNLKEKRLERLARHDGWSFERENIADKDRVMQIVGDTKPDVIINLAAQAGVRYSLVNPHAYVESNLVGFVNILEAARHNDVGHLVYASSSSVYGANESLPFSIHDNIDHPISLYAASKKSNELMAHTYSHLFGLPTTGLRFFTVYGPWGRPDMALFLFTEAILKDEPIKVFNHGNMSRDFTYIDDIVEGVIRVSDRPAPPNPEWNPKSPDPGTSMAPYRVYNIGNNAPVQLMDMIRTLEDKLGKEAKKNFMDIQPGDVPATYADVQDLIDDVDFKPETPLDVGIGNFVDWYMDFYGKR